MSARVVLAFLLLPTVASAQIITTVQNGYWTDPATWSCGCVPGAGTTLEIMHSVEIASDLTFTFNQVHVTTSGEITMMFPAMILIGGTFTMEGHTLLIGDIRNVGGTINVFGYFEAIGTFLNDGELIMDGGVLQVEGNLVNTLLIDGIGSICVYDTTDNQSTIAGSVDICDATPTTSTTPIVDYNSGTIAGTVTYCTNSACGFAGIVEDPLGAMALEPNPVRDHLYIVGMPPDTRSIDLRDAVGRLIRHCAIGSRIGVRDLEPGGYNLSISTATSVRTLRFIVE